MTQAKKKFNWFYILIAILFAAMLFVSLRYFKSSGNSSIGITAAKEYKINAEKSALVKSIPVTPGKEVKTGDLLVELTSSELEMEIDKLTNHIAALLSEKQEKTKLTQSKIAYAKAELGIDIEELNTDIIQAESELQLNRKLAHELNGIKDSIPGNHPMQMKISALKQQRRKHDEAVAIKVNDILNSNEADQKLLQNQIQLQQRELDLMNDEKKKLNKYAAADGVIENVYVKAGEQVDAYTPLLSINPIHPVSVIGFLVGKKEIPPINTKVSVSSYEHPKISVAGKVIGYGSVIDLPEILQKSTAVKAFGRQIFIEIEPDNNFAAGEKVLIR
jgi:multidrug resistance efflux pump